MYFEKRWFYRKVSTNEMVFLFLISLLLFKPMIGMFIACIVSPLLSGKERCFISILCLTISILFFSLNEAFSDLSEYLKVYIDINNVDIFNYSRFGNGIEIFILILMKGVYYITNGDEFGFLLITYTLILVLFMKLCFKVDRKFYLLIFGVVFYSFGFMQAVPYNLRQVFSVIFLLYMILSKSYISSVLFAFLSIISHVSSLINISIYLLIRSKSWLLLTLSVFCFVMFILMRDNTFISYALSKLDGGDMFNTLRLSDIIIHNVQVLPLLLFAVYRKKAALFDIRARAVFYLYLINYILYWLFISIPGISNRVSFIVLVFPLFLLVFYFLNEEVKVKEKYVLLASLLFFNFLTFIYISYNIEYKRNDLTFFENKPLTASVYDIGKILNDRISLPMKYKNLGN